MTLLRFCHSRLYLEKICGTGNAERGQFSYPSGVASLDLVQLLQKMRPVFHWETKTEVNVILRDAIIVLFIL